MDLFEKAKAFIPGGVNSPVRAFNAVGGNPVFYDRGQGPWLFDGAGKRYVDYVGAWGPMILGHAHPAVVEAVVKTAEKGFGFGASHALEVQFAELLCQSVPSLDKVRLVNSGTEACMSAIRLARGYTGRDKIIKFAGCYHGHSDGLLVEAGSGLLTHALPSSAGVPHRFAEQTLVANFNDLASVEQLFTAYPQDIAAIIVEPVAGNMGCVPPAPGFLEGLRQLCDQDGAILIFDEVMTGFRLSLGGAQEKYQVQPDLTTMAKVIGGGLPLAAFGGSASIMDYLAPVGPVYQAGTLSGNPVAVAAGLATLQVILQDPDFYRKLDQKGERFAQGIRLAAEKAGVGICVNQVGSMLSVFFTDQPQVADYQAVKKCSTQLFSQFFQAVLAAGINWPPSAFESLFFGQAHDESVIDQTIDVVERVFTGL